MIRATINFLFHFNDLPVFAVQCSINTLEIKIVAVVKDKADVIITVFLISFTTGEIRKQFCREVIGRAVIHSDISKRNLSMICRALCLLGMGSRSNKEKDENHPIPRHSNYLHR